VTALPEQDQQSRQQDGPDVARYASVLEFSFDSKGLTTWRA